MALPLGSLGGSLFDLHLGIDEKIFRSLLVFIFLAIALRLGGKRELAQINVLDLAVLLLASNALQNALIGNDSTVTGGVIGAGNAVRGQLRLRPLTYRSARVRADPGGNAERAASQRQAGRKAMPRRRSPRTELADIALEQRMSDFDSVGLIMIETSGKLVLPQPRSRRSACGREMLAVEAAD